MEGSIVPPATMIMQAIRFKKKIWDYYRTRGRDLPWRNTRNPYRILVSEIMLQQTQVSRVLVKYPEFLKKFPTIARLAKAKRSEVLKAWQGLGYNRRAVALHRIAQGGAIPKTVEELEKLPGVGPYTARAIGVFAFNQPVVMIETNIRRVFIHAFDVMHDRDIYALVEKTLPRTRTREWYYALMDYGAMLAKTVPNPNRRSVHYTRQSKFEGSNRQVRGAILRTLLAHPRLAPGRLADRLGFDRELVILNVRQLRQEGLL